MQNKMILLGATLLVFASARALAQGAAPAAAPGATKPAPAVGQAPGAAGPPIGAKTAAVESQTDFASESLFAGLMDPFEYDPRGRKDPFVQPIADKALKPGAEHGPLLPLQAYNLDQLRLVGIIWDVRHPKAMIKDPDGKTHIVGPNTKLGPKNGYIAVIREGEMVVVETTEQLGKLVSTAQVVKIAK